LRPDIMMSGRFISIIISNDVQDAVQHTGIPHGKRTGNKRLFPIGNTAAQLLYFQLIVLRRIH